MSRATTHLDKTFAALRPLAMRERPPKGWLRAIRDALGLTSEQLGRRLHIAQPSVVELEQSEVRGAVTLKTLQRAAEALDCRLVYALVPIRPLAEVINARANTVAERRLASVEQTMLLENQAVRDKKGRAAMKRQLIAELLRKPARLWDEM